MKRIWNTNEKVAREISGLEGDSKHFIVNDKNSDELWITEASEKYNEKVEEYSKKYDSYAESINETAKNIPEDLEIKAINNNIIVYVMDQNPFQKIKTSESGIITDLGGMAPEYKSNETGEYEEEESFIHVGSVFDVGPECKWIKEGDIIMWTKPSEMPIPFYRQNIVSINESRVLCVVNNGLTERFEKIKNNGRR